MRSALERHAALLVLGAGGGLAGVSALFSAGSSNGRLVWLGLAALALSGAAATGVALGRWPVLSRETLVALGLLAAFVCWCGISILWSIEPDRSWEYLNRGLVYVAFAVVGLAVGGPRVEGAGALLLGGGVGLAVSVWALSRPGLADDAQTHSLRVHDGAWFAVVFVLAAIAVGALAYLGSLVEERRRLTEPQRL